MDKDIDLMTGDELREEIIKIVKAIDNVELLEEIYHFARKLLRMERTAGD